MSLLPCQVADSDSLEAATTPLILQYLRTLLSSNLVDAGKADINQAVRRYCRINGVVAASSESEARAWTNNNVNDNASDSASTTFPINAVLVEGDEIASDNTGLQIGGFVVN